MKCRGLSILGIALFAVLVGGCAENRYIYRPAQQATATVGSLPAARYAIPAERPTGEVLVASSGLTELPGAEARTPALFVRVVVTNNSDDVTWIMDTAQQLAIIGGQKQSPAHVNSYNQKQPTIEIPRGEKRLVDFYYRLPGNMNPEDAMPQFDFAWNVQTGPRLIAERTSFDRMRVEPIYAGGYYYPYGYYGPYWGPYWHDPFWRPYPYYYGGVYIGASRYYGGYRGYGGYGGGYYGGGYRGGGGGRGGYIRSTPGRR
jgi:hypothetical protein